MNRFRPLLCGLCAAVALSAAAQEVKEPLPSLSSTVMTVPWEDFRRLWEAATPKEKELEPEVKKKLPPPVPWSVSSANVTGAATGEGSITFEATYEITVLEEREWSLIPVLGNDAAPIRATVNGEPHGLTLTDNNWHGIVVDEPGKYNVVVEFLTATFEEDGEVSFQFGVPKSPVTTLRIQIPEPDAKIAAPGGAVVSVARDDAGLTANLAYLTSDSLSLRWTKPAPAAAVPEEAEADETRISAVTSTLTTISDQFVQCNSNVQIDVLRGAAEGLTFTLPTGVNVIDVQGQGLAWTVQAEAAQQSIEVSINHEITDSYTFDVQYEIAVENEFGTVRIPLLRLGDVARETGFLAVAAAANVELGPGPEIVDLTRIDNRELPSILISRSANPILLAFKYPSGDPVLTLDIRKLKDEPVRGASIERAELSTMVTEQGYRITRAHYDVRNNIKQFLKLDIEGEIDIWNAEVGGQPVKPARDAESDAILIPLFKSAVVQRSLETFPVELLYMRKANEQYTIEDTLTFSAPVPDIPVGKMFWNVLLPGEKEIIRSEGDLTPLKEMRGPYDTVSFEDQNLRPVVRQNRETLWALREGIERFLITDINNPAASAVGQSGNGFPGAGEGGRAGEPAPLDPRREGLDVAGLLPMRADFAMEGEPNVYKRLIVPAGKPMTLTLELRDRPEPPDGLRSRIAWLSLCAGLFPLAFLTLRTRSRLLQLIVFAIPVLAAIAAVQSLVAWDVPWGIATRPFGVTAIVCATLTGVLWWFASKRMVDSTES
jgi:hypothetical protein